MSGGRMGRQGRGAVSRRPGWMFVLTAAGSLTVTGILPLTSAAGAAGATEKVPQSAIAAGRDRLMEVTQLPGHWTPSSFGSATQGESSGGNNGCGLPEPGVVQSHPFVESPFYDQKGSSVEVQEEIDVFPNARQASTDMKFGVGAAVTQCVVQAFNQKKSSIVKGFGDGATVGTITAQTVPVTQYGQGAVDMRVTIPLQLDGAVENLYQDGVVIVQGKYEAVIDETDFVTPIPTALQSTIDRAVAGRL
jgi:hypothetical protein